MKKIILAVVFLLLATHAFALTLGTEITVSDNNIKNEKWHKVNEDQEVEPGMAHGQLWDLEGFFQSGSLLSLVGGYDFLNGVNGIDSGDIFIDINGDAVYGDIHNSATAGNVVVNQTFGYDYVFDLDFSDPSNFSFDLYSLDGGSSTVTSKYTANQGSNPWRYDSGGVFLESGSFNYLAGLSSAEAGGFAGGLHNVLQLDLNGIVTDILAGGGTLPVDFTAHFTMECGNDNIIGKGNLPPTPTPEPSTVLLFGVGLMGLGVFAKRKRYKSLK